MKQYLHIFSYHHEDLKLYKLEQKYIYGQKNTQSRYFLSEEIQPISDSSFGETIIDVFHSASSLEELRLYLKENLPFLEKVRMVNLSIGFLPKCSFNDLSKLFRSVKLSAELKKPDQIYILTRTEDTWFFGKQISNCPRQWSVHRSKPETMSSAIPHILAHSVVYFLKHLGSQTIIDFCCGSGTFCLEAASMNLKVTAMDLNPNMVEMTKKNMRHFGYDANYLNDNAATTTESADSGIVDFPYGFHCERDHEEETSIIKNSIKQTKWVCLIHGEDITQQIHTCGGTVFEQIVIPAVNVKRYIHFVRKKDV